MESAQPTKVFTSYCWTSEAHKSWVLSLATRLKSDGVEVVLDRWHLQPGHDKYAFMERAVTDATICKVLVVCDQAYAEKADARNGGVGTETQIISPEVYNKVSQEKFIPLVRQRKDDGDPCLPTYMKARIYFDFSDDDRFDEEYDRLLRNLLNAPELVEPPIGKPPPHLFNRPGTMVKTAGKFKRVVDALERQIPHRAAVVSEYLTELAIAVEEFRIVSPDDDVVPDELVLQRIEALRPYRDQFAEFCTLFATRFDTNDGYIAVHDFLERLLLLHYHSPAGGNAYSEWHFDHHRYISYEWVLYLVAVLLRHRRFGTAARLMNDKFQFQRYWGQGLKTVDIGEFSNYIRILDEYRKQRLKLNYYSVAAEMIKTSAQVPQATFRELHQADLILTIWPLVRDQEANRVWYPHLACYIETGGGVELFARASTGKGASALCELFGYSDVKDVAKRVLAAVGSQQIAQLMQHGGLWRAGANHLFHTAELARVAGQKT